MLGMPGAGKTEIGSKLAEELDYRFLDLDEIIMRGEGKGHALILVEEGRERLQQLEEEYTMRLKLDNSVFAPGGSIVYSQKVMEKLHAETTIVLLRVELETLRWRLRNVINSRGIIGLENMTFDEVYEERMPMYERYSHEIIDSTKLNEIETLRKVYELLTSKSYAA